MDSLKLEETIVKENNFDKNKITDKVDKVDIEDLISGLKVIEVKALEVYLNSIWKVNKYIILVFSRTQWRKAWSQ
jgi:hypothetical protein